MAARHPALADYHDARFGATFNPAEAEKMYGPPHPLQNKKSDAPSYLPQKAQRKTVEHTPGADFVPSDTSNLQEGQKVEHQKFGFGKVVKMEGSGRFGVLKKSSHRISHHVSWGFAFVKASGLSQPSH